MASGADRGGGHGGGYGMDVRRTGADMGGQEADGGGCGTGVEREGGGRAPQLVAAHEVLLVAQQRIHQQPLVRLVQRRRRVCRRAGASNAGR